MNDSRSCHAEMFASLILPVPPPHPHFDSQLRSFGAKLKERNNLFRKRSKAQSHEMKEVLYANIVQANEVGDSAPGILYQRGDDSFWKVNELFFCHLRRFNRV